MNSIVGFFVGILQATFSLFGLGHEAPAMPVDTADQTQVGQTLTPQQVVDQYGTLPHGLNADSSLTNKSNPANLYNYAGGEYDVKYDDFNFDGLQDKVVVDKTNNDAYRGFPHKDIYVKTTSGKYILSDELTKIINGTGSFKVDQARKRIITYGAGSCCTFYGMEYDVVPNIGLREVYRITEDSQSEDVPKGKIKVTIETIEQGRKDGAQGWMPALGEESVKFYDVDTYKYWTGNSDSQSRDQKVPTPATSNKTYTDTQYGFSIDYPTGSVVDTEKHDFGNRTRLVSIRPGVSVYVSSTATDDCAPGPYAPSTGRINGVTFKTSEVDEPAAGQLGLGRNFSTVRGNLCFRVEAVFVGAEPGHYTGREAQDVQEGNEAGLRKVLAIANTFRFTGSQPSAGDSLPVPGMSKYTDSDFGFSFWYPTVWKVYSPAGDEPGIRGDLEDCTLKKTYSIHSEPRSNGVSIGEYYCPNLSMTLRGVGASPVGMDFKYYFDTNTHTWMETDLSDPPNGSPRTTSPANTSKNTMGGLHMFAGEARFGANVVVPLSARNFLIISTNDVGGYIDERVFANTIVATDPSVASPVSSAEQIAAIQAEKDAYTGQ